MSFMPRTLNITIHLWDSVENQSQTIPGLRMSSPSTLPQLTFPRLSFSQCRPLMSELSATRTPMDSTLSTRRVSTRDTSSGLRPGTTSPSKSVEASQSFSKQPYRAPCPSAIPTASFPQSSTESSPLRFASTSSASDCVSLPTGCTIPRLHLLGNLLPLPV
jgi:hypothetical protein